MKKIEIEWLYDDYDLCETCGPSCAEGAKVYIDGVLAIDRSPAAHCFNGTSYSEAEIYDAILKWLGYDVSVRDTPETPSQS